MRLSIAIVVSIIEVFAAYLLYCGLIKKRASFQFRWNFVLVICGVFMGIGITFLDGYLTNTVFHLAYFMVLLKINNLRLSRSFNIWIFSFALEYSIQIITFVIIFLPIKNAYIISLIGELIYLTFVILLYWKIPLSNLLQLAEQNLVFRFLFYVICVGLFIIISIFDFYAYERPPIFLLYLAVIIFSGLGIYKTAVIIQKYTNEIPARYHEHDNIIAGLVSLCMIYGNDELQTNISSFLEGFDKKEYADKMSAALNNENDFLLTFLKIKQSKASEKEVNITYDITYVENKHVSKTDTIKIIGIMLDNAIEHCDKGQEVFTDIFITEYVFDVEVKNPFKGSAENLSQIFQRGYSSKKGNLGGYGLNNLWNITNKNNGKVMVQALGEFITFKVLI